METTESLIVYQIKNRSFQELNSMVFKWNRTDEAGISAMCSRKLGLIASDIFHDYN